MKMDNFNKIQDKLYTYYEVDYLKRYIEFSSDKAFCIDGYSMPPLYLYGLSFESYIDWTLRLINHIVQGFDLEVGREYSLSEFIGFNRKLRDKEIYFSSSELDYFDDTPRGVPPYCNFKYELKDSYHNIELDLSNLYIDVSNCLVDDDYSLNSYDFTYINDLQNYVHSRINPSLIFKVEENDEINFVNSTITLKLEGLSNPYTNFSIVEIDSIFDFSVSNRKLDFSFLSSSINEKEINFDLPSDIKITDSDILKLLASSELCMQKGDLER